MLDLNTNVKGIEASEIDELTVKQIIKEFNAVNVYDTLKAMLEIRTQWLNCSRVLI